MNNERTYKILKIAIIVLAFIFVVEAIYFGYRIYERYQNTIYYSSINDCLKKDDNYIAVGFSDFKHSDNYEYEDPGYIKPALFVYDNNFNLTKEIKLEEGLNGSLTDIIDTGDGYVVVGYVELSKKSGEETVNEALIIKYDYDFNVLWQDKVQILDNNKFLKVALDKNNDIVAVGTSIYNSGYIGNHTTGGGILIKYNQDGEELMRTNYGGPNTDSFNDLVITDDFYLVVGTVDTGTGFLIKYDYEGKELDHQYYGYTDSLGLTSISRLGDDEFIVTTSKLKEKNSTDSYEAALLKYNSDLELLSEKKVQESDISRFQDTVVIDDKIVALMAYGVKENNILVNDTMLIEYDQDLNELKRTTLEGDHIVTLNNLIYDGNDYIAVGNTDSKVEGLKTNGKDFYGIIIKYNKELQRN